MIWWTFNILPLVFTYYIKSLRNKKSCHYDFETVTEETPGHITQT